MPLLRSAGAEPLRSVQTGPHNSLQDAGGIGRTATTGFGGADAQADSTSWFRVGGVRISVIDRPRAVDRFFGLAGVGGWITVTSAHGVVEAQRDRRLLDIIEGASMTLPDGMPIYWAGRFLRRQNISRVPGTEFFSDVLRDPRARSIRHFFYGASESTVLEVVRRATATLGAGMIAGWHCPPMRAVGALEDSGVMTAIRATQPDVVWVGLSTPKQEYWMANHHTMLPNTVLVGVGAAFDFYADRKRRGPAIMSDSGLEWLYRLATEPRRLWPRYRAVVPTMLAILGRDAVQRRAS